MVLLVLVHRVLICAHQHCIVPRLAVIRLLLLLCAPCLLLRCPLPSALGVRILPSLWGERTQDASTACIVHVPARSRSLIFACVARTADSAAVSGLIIFTTREEPTSRRDGVCRST